MSRDTLEVVTLRGRGGAMAPSGERPGMLLGILHARPALALHA